MIFIILALIIYFSLFYLWALSKKDFSVIDIAWGPSFLIIFGVSAFQKDFIHLSQRQFIVGILILIWSVRLSGYILKRSLKLKKEDYRYAQWREDWGKNANMIAYFRVYLLQALLSLMIGYPIILLFNQNEYVSFGTWLDISGVTLWIIGFSFEAVADFQKNKFKSNPSNQSKPLQEGLWKYSRHPNYFGEAILWWGLSLMIMSEVFWLKVLWGPLWLNFMLLRVSGVSLLEKKYEGNLEYMNYQKKTNGFIPWFPKK